MFVSGVVQVQIAVVFFVCVFVLLSLLNNSMALCRFVLASVNFVSVGRCVYVQFVLDRCR